MSTRAVSFIVFEAQQIEPNKASCSTKILDIFTCLSLIANHLLTTLSKISYLEVEMRVKVKKALVKNLSLDIMESIVRLC